MLLRAVLVVLSTVPAVHTSAFGQATEGQSIEVLVNEVALRNHSHGVPYGEAQRLGPPAIPHLTALLDQESMKAHYRTIVQILNYAGAPNAFPVLRDFVLNRFSGEVDDQEYLAMSAAVFTMGPLARISPAAMQFLVRGCIPETWSELGWTYRPYSDRERNLALSRKCLVALGSSGTEEADRILDRIHQDSTNEYWKELKDLALEMRAINQGIVQEGFENHRRRQDEHFAKHGGVSR